MSIKKFPDWEAPAKLSKTQRAISEPFDYTYYSKTFRKVTVYKVEIVKPLYGDPYMVYRGSGIKVPVKVTARMVDSVRAWKVY